MNAEAVNRGLASLDYRALTAPAGGELLYDFVLNSGVEDVLELGFAHGTSTAYIAAALQERGEGAVVTIDRKEAVDRRPNIFDVTRGLGLQGYVRPIFAERSYNWELLHLLEHRREAGSGGWFDFCFFDGAHTWETDGLAFFLVDKLLRPDRWILFDDLHWTQESSPALSPEKAQDIPDEERLAAQVHKVFDLLVREHPSYTHFRLMGSYGWAYKSGENGDGAHAADVDEAIDPEIVRRLAFGPPARTRIVSPG
jgi:predicted O-methyltransferase YrrM